MLPDKPKIQLTDEQRQELKAAVKASVLGMLNDREDLRDKNLVMRRIWQELVNAPQWSIVENENRPQDAPNEIWSMTPTVNKL